MKKKVNDLTNEELNWAAGIASGFVWYPTDSIERGEKWHLNADIAPHGETIHRFRFRPTINWDQGGPIIERNRMTTGNVVGEPEMWSAEIFKGDGTGVVCICTGPTLLIAAMRCFVSSKLGNEIEVPDGV